MTHYTRRQLEKKRKEKRKAQIMGIVGAGLAGLGMGLCMLFAR